MHDVKVTQVCLVTNRFLGRGISSVKVGKDILGLLEDEGLNHLYLTNGIDVNFLGLQNSHLLKYLKDTSESSHITVAEITIIVYKSVHGDLNSHQDVWR